MKFVPASGAASRMFKNLFEFLGADYDVPTTSFEKKFFDHIHSFAFYNDLNAACLDNTGKDIEALLSEHNYKAVVANLLESAGLNYGSLPKGLLKFHRYADGVRTPLEEHLVEGALYAAGKTGKVNVHFTVSGEHRALFQKLVDAKVAEYTQKYGVEYNISFSEQKASTDTIAADMENKPFRDNGKLLFRPGGHGALIENLNDLDADIVFIKNIDNVVPDRLKDDTVTYKNCLPVCWLLCRNRLSIIWNCWIVVITAMISWKQLSVSFSNSYVAARAISRIWKMPIWLFTCVRN